MDPAEQSRLEELRREVLRFFYDRAALAFNSTSIHLGVSRAIRCTIEECENAAEFLLGHGMLFKVPNNLGARRYYQISSQGKISYESGI